LLALEHGVQHVRFLAPLVERRQGNRAEPLILVKGPGLDAVVVNTDLLVRVPDGEVEGEVVVEGVVVGEVELREGGIRDVELDTVRADDEPKDEERQSHDDDGGHDELEDKAEDAAAAAAEASAATAARAMVGLGFGRD